MWAKMHTSFFGLMVLLVVILQVMVPFLHAHTGQSSHSGLHAPDSFFNHFQPCKNSRAELASKHSEESFAVQVGLGLSNEEQKLVLGERLIQIAIWTLTKPTHFVDLKIFLVVPDRISLSLYRSESNPPPSLAPPSQL